MKKSILGCAVAAVLVNASNTIAGGLWLNEYGDFSGGRASAGAGAGLDGAESIIHNPASSTRLKGNTLFASGGVMVPDIKFDLDYTTPELGTGNGGQAGETPLALPRPMSTISTPSAGAPVCIWLAWQVQAWIMTTTGPGATRPPR